jgi:hypothetical protein
MKEDGTYNFILTYSLNMGLCGVIKHLMMIQFSQKKSPRSEKRQLEQSSIGKNDLCFKCLISFFLIAENTLLSG